MASTELEDATPSVRKPFAYNMVMERTGCAEVKRLKKMKKMVVSGSEGPMLEQWFRVTEERCDHWNNTPLAKLDPPPTKKHQRDSDSEEEEGFDAVILELRPHLAPDMDVARQFVKDSFFPDIGVTSGFKVVDYIYIIGKSNTVIAFLCSQDFQVPDQDTVKNAIMDLMLAQMTK